MATKSNEVSVGSNVVATMDGTVMVIRVDLSKSQGESKSGKSVIIATTAGNAKFQGPKGEIVIGLNVYTKK